MRRSSIVLGLLGVLLVAAAAIVRFVVVPTTTALPSDLDVNVHYAGKGSLLNAAALATGDVANALVKDIDVTIDRHVFVSKTDGDTAVVHDDSTLTAGGQKLADNHTYAINRDSRAQATAPAGEKVDAHTDLTIALPLDPKADNSYKLYDAPTGTSSALTFVAAENKGGRDTNHYTAQAAGPVKNPALTATLPPALPKALAVKLVPLLPAATQQALQPLVAALPDTIPLTYTVSSTYNVWADKALGAPIDSSLKRTITANASLGGQTLPLLAVLDINLTQTPASVQDRADDADSKATQLSMLGTWLPVGLLVIGVVLIGLAFLRRKPAAAAKDTAS